MTKNDKPKLRDVARLAGVSLGSASRALSNPDQVKPATLAKVDAAVRQLQYVMDGAARALALRRTFSVAAIFPTLNNPIYADSIQALQQRLNACGYQLIIASHEYDRERELSSVRNFIERGVEGVFLVGTDHDAAVFELLHRSQRPYVLMWSVDDCREHCAVGFSNVRGGELIAEHVLALGHREVAILTGQRQYNERARYRIEGVRQRFARLGIEVPENRIVEQPFSLEGGRAGFEQVLAMQPRPTALICTTDLLALGACEQAKRRQLSVPADMTITGFDDISFSAIASPSLTSISIPIFEIGRISADTLIAQIEGVTVDPVTELDIALVVRESSEKLGPGQP
ncbi:substrate-binding domain-containing protein [Pseudomonas sp. NPDC089395]|uniref:LacI family DNA-binding transcriptional regulator n=1 Tax=Pseudomonas sp. NPDC089395 TaxID=3364460 RepID=UPI00380774DA